MAAKPIWKHPDDVLIRALSFAGVLPEGVDLTGTPSYAVTEADGTALDGAAGDLTAAHVSTGGQEANVRIEAGAEDVDYRITCQADAANGETYNRAITVKVRSGL